MTSEHIFKQKVSVINHKSRAILLDLRPTISVNINLYCSDFLCRLLVWSNPCQWRITFWQMTFWRTCTWRGQTCGLKHHVRCKVTLIIIWFSFNRIWIRKADGPTERLHPSQIISKATDIARGFYLILMDKAYG